MRREWIIAVATVLVILIGIGIGPGEAQAQQTRPPESTWSWHPYVDTAGVVRQAWGWREGPNTCWIPSRQPKMTEPQPTAHVETSTAALARADPQPTAALANGVVLNGGTIGAPGRFESNDPDFKPPDSVEAEEDMADAVGPACGVLILIVVGSLIAVLTKRRR